MTATRSTLAAVLLAALVQPLATGQVTYEDVNGIRFQVTRQVVPRQIPVTTTQQQQLTSYKQQVTVENVPHQQVYNVPVTQYQIVSELHGRWNPFVTPYWTHRYEPVTVWQQQVATVQIPVSRVSWAPETRTVEQPVTKWETHNQEIVMRTPIGPTPAGAGANTALAARPLSGAASATVAAVPSGSTSTNVASRPVGGETLTSDPPRAGTQWPSSSTPATSAPPSRY